MNTCVPSFILLKFQRYSMNTHVPSFICLNFQIYSLNTHVPSFICLTQLPELFPEHACPFLYLSCSTSSAISWTHVFLLLSVSLSFQSYSLNTRVPSFICLTQLPELFPEHAFPFLYLSHSTSRAIPWTRVSLPLSSLLNFQIYFLNTRVPSFICLTQLPDLFPEPACPFFYLACSTSSAISWTHVFLPLSVSLNFQNYSLNTRVPLSILHNFQRYFLNTRVPSIICLAKFLALFCEHVC
jgi:hypothetical protein